MLYSDPTVFINYANVEHDEQAAAELVCYAEIGFLRQFDSYKAVVAFLGEEPVLSKIGVIEKIRAGKSKKRIVLDSKQSGVSAASSKKERVVLPRILDAVFDMLDLQALGDGD
eukprot:6322787-Heterocapsa_arctica.AAC.1